MRIRNSTISRTPDVLTINFLKCFRVMVSLAGGTPSVRSNFKKWLLVISLAIVLGMSGCCLSSIFENEIWILIIGLLLINVTYVFFYRRVLNKIRRHDSVYTDLVSIFLICFTLYAVAYPIDYVTGVLSNDLPQNVMDTLQLYVIADVAFIVGSVLATRFHHTSQESAVNALGDHTKGVLERVASICLCIGLVMMVYDEFRSGGLGGITDRLKTFQYSIQMGASTISLPYNELISSSLLMLAYSVEKRDVRKLLLIVTTVCCFYFFWLGSRNYIMVSVWPCLALLLTRGHIRLTKKTGALLLSCIVALLSPLFSNIRNCLISGTSLGSLPPQAWAFSKGELGGAFTVAMKIYENRGWITGADPSYFTGVFYMLPKPIYQIIFAHPKPIVLGYWFAENYMSKMFLTSGVSWGFSPVIQAWMNGGVVVLLIVFCLIGFAFTSLNKKTIMTFVLLPSSMWFQRSEFYSFLNLVVFTGIFVLAMLCAARIVCGVNRSRRSAQHSTYG